MLARRVRTRARSSRRFRFIADNAELPRRTRRSSSSSSRAPRSASRSLIALPLGDRPRPPPPRLGPRDRRLDRRPRAAEHLPDRGLPHRARARLREQHGRARRARDRPDPHERLRRRRRASTATSSRRRAAWACPDRRSCGAIELPLALPLLFTGIRVAAVTVVATAPIAALAGGGGLGDIIVNQATLPPAGRARRLVLRDGALGGSMDRRCWRCRKRQPREASGRLGSSPRQGQLRKEGL